MRTRAREIICPYLRLDMLAFRDFIEQYIPLNQSQFRGESTREYASAVYLATSVRTPENTRARARLLSEMHAGEGGGRRRMEVAVNEVNHHSLSEWAPSRTEAECISVRVYWRGCAPGQGYRRGI